ncbi:MAG: polymer-forming cytoskeletal protein [Patescibacteria group bacterium]|nr:polymer-forming cytoskeletal protein [Patescibacteria group bacterium]
MFKSQDEKEKIKEVETIIGPSIRVKGNFNGQGNIVVEGILEGSLKTNGDVFIGDKAKIAASVEAREARIGGEVTGNIKIKKYMEVAATGKIFGDIECSSLSVERGAILNGKCTMLPERKDETKS